MSRLFRESNASQAVREIVQGIGLVPGSFLGVAYVCRRDDAWFCKGEKNERTSSIFFVFSAAGLIILSREIGWFIRFMVWIVRQKFPKKRHAEPRFATPRFYAVAALFYTSLIIFTLGPLYYFSISDVSKIRDIATPYLFGCLVGALTGDFMSGGAIAGLESWTITNQRHIAIDLKYILMFVGTVLLFVLHHALSTLLAISGCYPLYLKYLKLVRWRWDYFSDTTVNDLESPKILSRTSSQRPYPSYDEF